MLDEITTLDYDRKLHTTIVGESRGVLIKVFRKWKDENYIPKNVHKAIRWSKHDPLNGSDFLMTGLLKQKITSRTILLKSKTIL